MNLEMVNTRSEDEYTLTNPLAAATTTPNSMTYRLPKLKNTPAILKSRAFVQHFYVRAVNFLTFFNDSTSVISLLNIDPDSEWHSTYSVHT